MSTLTDMRAYFQLGGRRGPCRDEKPESGPQLGWLCTLPEGHGGSHVAHDLDGTLICRWPPTTEETP